MSAAPEFWAAWHPQHGFADAYAVAECVSLDEVKEIMNRAEAARAYARQASNRTLEIDAAEIRIRAQRRLGEMLLARLARAETFKLADLGVHKDLSAPAQLLAKQDPQVFEAGLAKWRDGMMTNSRLRTTATISFHFRRPIKARSRSPFWFKLQDKTPIGRAKIGKLRARIATCEAEASLLRAIIEHVGNADALASIEDCIKPGDLGDLIAQFMPRRAQDGSA